MEIKGSVGIIGGNGQLGSAIARGMLKTGVVVPGRFWIGCRSGRADALGDVAGLRITTDNQALVEACGTVILSVPPAQAGQIAISAPDRLLISVMAGVTLSELAGLTGARRIIRAMSSPAASDQRAYSPWVAGGGVTAGDRTTAEAIFAACGLTDEITNEAHIDNFTAMTGPVPGFVALFADCMIRHATDAGIAPAIAERAIRQLFLASGEILGSAPQSPADQVRAMLDYAGTTAAGLQAMEAAGLEQVIAKGLDAAIARARAISRDS
ncbi:MAG: pyrroline-5-carboxylate reductase dimerization domain-containing protein [Albidovulum sp.]